MFTTCLVLVNILDMNDNSPTFTRQLYVVNATEASPIGTVVLIVSATDPDQGRNGDVSYGIRTVTVQPPVLSPFAINASTGAISLANTLDHDTVPVYNLTVKASDGADRSLTSAVKVIVNVLDVNDNQPIFTLSNYYASVVESIARGQSIVTVLATDRDRNPITYSLATGNDYLSFGIGSTNGSIVTITSLDREARDPYVFRVLATDGASPPQTGTATVYVDVIDVNDNAPRFAHTTYSFSASERLTVGSALGQIVATDADDGSNGQIMYAITPANSAFLIQSATGILELNTQLDYNTQRSYVLTVTATDGGTPAMSSAATVTVNIQDANTNAPLFSAPTYTAVIPENSAVGTSVTSVTATDPDPGPSGLMYSILHGANGMFSIDSMTGVVSLARAVDYEVQDRYELVVQCRDSYNQSLSSATFVIIQLSDVNDHSPVFSPSTFSFVLSQFAGTGTWILNASATDLDAGTNAVITYSRGAGAHLSVSPGGIVTIGSSPPREGSFTVDIQATDGGNPARSGTLRLMISIRTSTTNPEFSLNQYVVAISENRPLMMRVVRPVAHLPEASGNGQLMYSLVGTGSSMFSIERYTGVVAIASRLNREAVSRYILTVTATFAPEGVASNLVGSSQVIITLMDFNDNAPVFSTLSVNRVLNISQSDPAGTVLGTVSATDADAGTNARVTYGIISGGDGVIRIDPFFGILYTSDVLNAGLQSVYYVIVSATNRVLFPLQSNMTVTVNVLAVNDHNPTFVQTTYTYHLPENSNSSLPFGSVSATDPDSGSLGTIRYRLVTPVPANFAVSSTTGALTLTGRLDREVTDHVMFRVQATDGASPPLSDVCSVYVYVDDVNDNSPTFTQSRYTTTVSANTPPRAGIIAVHATDPDAGSFGTAGITYAITAGDSSLRFLMTSSGVIEIQRLLSQLSAVTYSLTVQASDGGSPPRTATAMVVVNVLATGFAAPMFPFSSFAVAHNDGIAAGTVLFTAQATGSGFLTYSVHGTGLPFSLNSTTGVVTASRALNADSQSVYTIPIVATDSYGQSASMLLTISLVHINEHAPIFNPVNATASVSENAAVGTSVLTVCATDQDTGSDGMLSYGILTSGPFTVNSQSGVVEVAQGLDREVRSVYSVVIIAMDQGTPALTAETYVTITVSDVNDNSPVFEYAMYNGSVLENVPAGTFVVRPVARDHDLNSVLAYRLTNLDGVFAINPSTGAITTLVVLDRERTPKYDLTVLVSDGKLIALCRVDIEVDDVNDHGPLFDRPVYTASVSALSPVGTTLVQVSLALFHTFLC